MPNLFQFSNTAPASGEIRAFFKTEIDNTKTVRALTVSNSSKNAIDVVPTLRQLQDIRLLVTGSGGHRTFTALSVVQKAGYFFVDNVDLPFATVSESINSEVTFTPFITTDFGNNDYNPLISNASGIRQSTDKSDLDKSAGNVTPKNFEAATGIDVRLSNVSNDDRFISTSLVAGGSFTGSAIPFRNDNDITVFIPKHAVDRALGNLDNAISKGTNPSGSVAVSMSIRVNSEPEFVLPDTSLQTIFTAEFNETINTKGYTDFTTKPFLVNIPSGSAATSSAGGTNDTNFYVRLETSFQSIVGSPLKKFYIQPDLVRVDKTQEYLTINYAPSGSNVPVPYAPKAEVQDSNYTATGFANARYNGSKTDGRDFGGIEPALTAKPISILPLTEGAISSSNDSPNSAYGRSWSNMRNLLSGVSGSDGLRAEYERFFEDVFFAGLRDIPSSKVGAIGKFKIAGANILDGPTDTVFDINNQAYGLRAEPGDLISYTSQSVSETMLVKQVIQLTKGHARLTVERGRGPNGTVASGSTFIATDADSIELFINQGDRIIVIDKNRVVPLQNSVMVINPQKVKDSPDDMVIVETNDRGFIFNSYTINQVNGIL